jgi:hypothetical protein
MVIVWVDKKARPELERSEVGLPVQSCNRACMYSFLLLLPPCVDSTMPCMVVPPDVCMCCALTVPQLLPVATENSGRLRFFSAVPRYTVSMLTKYGLTVADCPTVVLLDPLGAYGEGNKVRPSWPDRVWGTMTWHTACTCMTL